ncbi:hypothetical protein SAMN02745133_02064 [Desulforamulus putei DSM 12395]|uniref:Uncharacterized protein n=1 Tax=Desulforamulus putei DSM 12395 TaxID=1121429 RepID=A0A1M4ZQ13_9FIRM|nr:hypothetical protein SAMN02745133_02064 [Desulforamulus putei DSM 12395]
MKFCSTYLHSFENASGETEYWRISLVRIGNGFTLGTAHGPARNITIPCYIANQNEKEALKTMLLAIKQRLISEH